jgi:hypothetical protein
LAGIAFRLIASTVEQVGDGLHLGSALKAQLPEIAGEAIG